ncbi:hypothetical protein CHELA41_40064 [Hyphomicrobiales bacterium]|nr:hypothetical protein CHELA41_40064 [Hyphomicrobiales bacterium]
MRERRLVDINGVEASQGVNRLFRQTMSDVSVKRLPAHRNGPGRSCHDNKWASKEVVVPVVMPQQFRHGEVMTGNHLQSQSLRKDGTPAGSRRG